MLGTLLGHLFLETSSWKHLLENLFWEPCSPHLCVGFLFLVLYPAAFSSSSRRLPSSHIQLVITQCTHNSTHTQLAHIQLNSHNLLTHNSTHTQLAHTYNLSSYNLLTHTTQLTHNLLTCNSTHTTCHHTTCLTHTLPIHYSYTHAHVSSHNLTTHNLFTHNFLLTHNLSTRNLPTHNLSFLTSTFVSRGRRGSYGTGRALVAHRVLS